MFKFPRVCISVSAGVFFKFPRGCFFVSARVFLSFLSAGVFLSFRGGVFKFPRRCFFKSFRGSVFCLFLYGFASKELVPVGRTNAFWHKARFLAVNKSAPFCPLGVLLARGVAGYRRGS